MFPAQSWNSSQMKIGFAVPWMAFAICAAAASGIARADAIVAQNPGFRVETRRGARARSPAIRAVCSQVTSLLGVSGGEDLLLRCLDAHPQRPAKGMSSESAGRIDGAARSSSHDHPSQTVA